MSFSAEWDRAYREGTHLSRWPWSDLVSLTIRTFGGDLSTKNILEIGCGYGANIPFFLANKANYYAVDGSQTAIVSLRQRFPELRDHLEVADFSSTLVFQLKFDMIVDRAAVTHNNTEGIKRTLALSRKSLKPGGVYMGIDWFADDHSCARGGSATPDPFTRTGFTDGPFSGLGAVHFSTRAHLQDLFEGFDLIYLEKKRSEVLTPGGGETLSAWNFLARLRS